MTGGSMLHPLILRVTASNAQTPNSGPLPLCYLYLWQVIDPHPHHYHLRSVPEYRTSLGRSCVLVVPCVPCVLCTSANTLHLDSMARSDPYQALASRMSRRVHASTYTHASSAPRRDRVKRGATPLSLELLLADGSPAPPLHRLHLHSPA